MLSTPRREDAVLADVLERRAAEHPDKLFARFDGGATLSYGELAARTWTVARALRGLGARERDVVAAWLPNGEEALLAWFGANAAGCVYQPLNTAYRGAILEHALNLGKARVLIAHADLIPRLEGLDLPHLETVVTFDELPAAPAERPRLERPTEPWDDITILMTSG